MSYDILANKDSINKTVKALKANNFNAVTVANKEEALEAVKNLIPEGVSIMNGSSVTLSEIGFIDYLKSNKHNWNNLHANILAEKDTEKQNKLRKESVLSDYFVVSAHAITESGEIIFASNSGSQLPHLVYTSSNIIIVVGTQKIVSDLKTGLDRIEQYVFPLEDARAKGLGWGGSLIAKLLILKKENPHMSRKINVILVNEKLGY